ncbi:ABC transporter permease [Pseudarthrobacter sp. 1C304]|uniref:ABC transporter permease n=1 Tax=Pseudarthrobacter sp. 1C304 TaxID=3457438 RepID=UPI003FD42CEA
MLRVALAQVRLNGRRFIAIILAVTIAVGFLTSTLLINSSSKASLTQSVGQGFRNAQLVLSAESDDQPGAPGVLNDGTADVVRKVAGVDGIYAVRQAYVTLGEGKTAVSAQLSNTPEAAALFPVDVVQGSIPASGSEAAVDQDTATRLGLSPGSRLAITGGVGPPAIELTVSAIVATSKDPRTMGTPQLYATDTTAEMFTGPGQGFDIIQVALARGAGVSDVRDALAKSLAEGGFDGIAVRTADEQTQATVAAFTGGDDVLTTVLLAFGAVSLLVCALVVSNTFSVLVAQRTRELALLRCIGATRSQIRRSVMVEALLVGFVASVAGVAGAVALVGATVAYLKGIPESGFATLAVSPLATGVGVAVGVLMTVLAALVPARAATSVAPLVALRPADDVLAGTKRGRLRLSIGLALLAGGALLLGIGASAADLLLAVPGGMLSFVGVLMCATLFIPPLVRTVGSLAAPLGVPGKLAAVNAIRNPQRTSATSSALLIGVTLVAMMMTGASTARASLDDVLAREYPVDISITGGLLDDPAATAAAADAARSVDGVVNVVQVPVAGAVQLNGRTAPVFALDPVDAGKVLQDRDLELLPNTILMPQGTMERTVTVRGAGSDVELEVVVAGSRLLRPVISAPTAEFLGGAPATAEKDLGSLGEFWLSVEDSLSASELMDLRIALAEAVGVDESAIFGAAIERAAFEQVIDVLLSVVTGLLAVAIVIALVGVANTLSLSVLERTRESSLLRALGLTRGQLRGMLALEALLITGVAATFGCVLGALYGWLGAVTVLGRFTNVTPSLPWTQLAAVLAVALVAGLLASILPARRAARLSPVAGLNAG